MKKGKKHRGSKKHKNTNINKKKQNKKLRKNTQKKVNVTKNNPSFQNEAPSSKTEISKGEASLL